jgi:hypothetical protein
MKGEKRTEEDVLCHHLPGGIEENHKISVRIACIWAEI